MSAQQRLVGRAAQKAATRLVVWLYRRSGGSIAGRKGGMPVLLLTTTGRRSGQQWSVPLIFRRDGDRLVVVAAAGGSDAHPAWWLNLCAQPRATVQLGRQRFPVTAVQAAGEERDRIWPLMTESYPGYEKYARKTSRLMPVVLLHPSSESVDDQR